jgi:hypothetical protein
MALWRKSGTPQTARVKLTAETYCHSHLSLPRNAPNGIENLQRKIGFISKMFDRDGLLSSKGHHTADIFPIRSPALKVVPNTKTVSEVHLS